MCLMTQLNGTICQFYYILVNCTNHFVVCNAWYSSWRTTRFEKEVLTEKKYTLFFTKRYSFVRQQSICHYPYIILVDVQT